MIEFIPIASSSSGCCYLLSGGGTRQPLLIECGIRFDLIRKATGFQTSNLAGCLISHYHQDHCRSAEDLFQAGVDCYASGQTWAWCEARGFLSHRAKTIYPNQEFETGDWRVTAFEVPHDQPGTLAFVIDSPEGDRLLYATDLAYCPFTIPGLTMLAVECNWSEDLIKESTAAGTVHADRFRRTVRTHMSLERLLSMLKANDLSLCEKIFLLHLSSDNSDEQGFKLAVERATGIPTEVCAA